MQKIPELIGVIHLPPLPGSPRFGGSMTAVVDQAASDALALEQAGFEAVIVENFGDAPFWPERVEPVTVAAMTCCAAAARQAAPRLSMGINVLRNDALASLSIAAATGAEMIRVNVHIGARVTDQGIVEGRAHETLRLRRQLGLDEVALLCDVAVKHSAPLGDRPLVEEAQDVVHRGLADGVLLTGAATGSPVQEQDLEGLQRAIRAPVLIASGMSPDRLAIARRAHGVIVGSCLKRDGRAGEPVDPERAQAFVRRFRESR